MSGIAWRLQIFETLSSTQGLVSSLAERGEPEGLAVLARRQTAGRGREGRRWEGPEGNLCLSVLLRPRAPARAMPGFGLLAAVALHEAASRRVPELSLKWPNDLLRDGRKCAGILAEGALGPDGGVRHLVLGFGVNLASAPPVAGRETAALGPAPVEDVAHDLLAALDAWLVRERVEGFAPVRAAWEAAGPQRGATLTLRRPEGAVSGRYEGLAEDGGILLATGGRVHRFHAGELGG